MTENSPWIPAFSGSTWRCTSMLWPVWVSKLAQWQDSLTYVKDSWIPRQDVQILAILVQQFWFSCSQSPRVLLWMLNWKREPDKHRAEGQWNPVVNLSGKHKALPDHQPGSKNVVNGRFMCQRTPVTGSWGAITESCIFLCISSYVTGPHILPCTVPVAVETNENFIEHVRFTWFAFSKYAAALSSKTPSRQTSLNLAIAKKCS